VCTKSATLHYVGPDGQRMSATLEPYVAPTGKPAHTDGAEGREMVFKANGFKPGLAEGAISYRWRFQQPGQTADGSVPYGTPVLGDLVKYTWPMSGRLAAELTATDAVGRTATTTLWVDVGNIPPQLQLAPEWLSGPTTTPIQLSGGFDDAGEQSTLRVAVNWGDGSPVFTNCISVNDPSCITTSGPADVVPLVPRRSADGQSFVFDASHRYPSPGTYYGTIWVKDQAGATDSETFVARIVPTAPRDVTAEVAPASGLGAGQVKLAWTAPAAGQATITDYLVEQSFDGMRWATVPDEVSPATTSTLSGLDGLPIWMRVRAVSGEGPGTPSDPIRVTPRVAPIAPIGLTATVAPADGVGSGEVKLAWGGPIIGHEVTDYVIETSADGTTWTTVDDGVSTATQHTVSGLTNGTQYSFRVAARNTLGSGPWTPAITATPVWVPRPVFPLTLSTAPAPGVGSGQVKLTWNAPADNGAAISDYVIQYQLWREGFAGPPSPTWVTVDDAVATATTSMVSGLTNGTKYWFRIAATNVVGIGEWSPAVLATPLGAPGAPGGLTAAVAPEAGVGSGQVKLTWNPSASNGLAITDYVIESSVDGGATWATVNDGVSTATTYTVSGLTNGTQYSFRVAGKNAIWISPRSPAVLATPLGAPGAPGGLTAAVAPEAGVGSGQVKLTWNPSASNGLAITDYVIESSADGGATWTTVDDGVSTATTYTVSGLTNGTQYSFRVAGKNAIWISPRSPAVEAAPASVPDTPSSLRAVSPLLSLGRQVRLTWTAPANNGAAISDYVIERSVDGTSWTTVDDGVSTSTTSTVNGLTNALQYSFRVAATNTVGTGPWSSTVKPTVVLS